MLALTLKGTPFFFAGDEIGMEQVSIPKHQIQDPFEQLVPGYGLNRDPERSPMRWDNTRHGGFTAGEPWLPMGDDIAQRNVRTLKEDGTSLLWLYRRLISLRRRTPALTAGAYQPLRSCEAILCFKRTLPDHELLIALNTCHDPCWLEFAGTASLMLSTHLDREGETISGTTHLRADEGVILNLDT